MQGYALTLVDVVEGALSTNPDVLAAQKQRDARAKEARSAKAGYYPSVDLELGVGREWTQSPSTNQQSVELDRKEAAIRVRQMIFDGGAVSNEVSRTKLRFESSDFDAKATRENIALRVSELYIEVLRRSELLELFKASLDEHINIYDQMTLRSQAGVGSRSDLDQISARLALAQSNRLAAENNLKDVVSNFYSVVGYLPDITLLEDPNSLPVDNEFEEGLRKAFLSHPQLLSANADVESVKAQYKVSRSAFSPTISLEGDRTWNEDIDGIEGENEDWIVALRLRYRLFNGGANVARKKQAASLLDEAREVRNSTRRQVEEALRLSWNAYETTAKQMEALETYVDAVVATREAYQKQFNIGKRSLLDLLNTENEVLEAKTNYLNAFYDHLYASYRVYHGQGVLTENLELSLGQ